MSTASGKRKAQQTGAVIRLLILLAILIGVNLLASRLHYGLDLTAEKRFTLTTPVKKLLRNMDDVAVIDVYLEGKNFPPGFQRLREAVRERLQSFKEYGGAHIQYHFTDPFENKNEDEKAAIFQDFAAQKMIGLNIGRNEVEKSNTQIVIPYALVHYKDKSIPVLLTEKPPGMSPEYALNYSESLLEYKLASAINMASKPDKPRIAYVMGNGEAFGYQTADALLTLGSLYKLDTIDINDGSRIPSAYNALIICKPTQPFTERQKFKLDQYIMRGGNVLWMLDAMIADMDSFRVNRTEQFVSVDNPLNLNDMLFRYGVRVNSDLLEDLQCRSIYVNEMMMNGQAEPKLKSWYYFPLFVPTSHHPIVNNMTDIQGKFVSTVDTIANSGVRKTVLLESSQYSRPSPSPVRVSMSMMRFAPNPELFNKGFRPTAVLLEGRFQSVFQDRIPADFRAALDSLKQPFVGEAQRPGTMIVAGDGDLMLNEVSTTTGPVQLGYSMQEKTFYANKSFLLNCMDYLTDSSGILEARSKDVRLRLLDGGRTRSEQTKWQALNIGLPIALVLVFASCYLFFRKRRYEGA